MKFENLLNIVAQNTIAVSDDSRNIQAGAVFVAVKGTQADGHNYAEKALAAGARYIVAQQKLNIDPEKLIIVENSSLALAHLSQASAQYPAKKLINLAVTGTNGKTTVAFLTQSIIKNTGKKAGLISTVTNDTVKNKQDATMTTPGPVEIANMQKQMVAAGAEYMVTEASSHALDQNRLAGVKFTAAGFTNLTGEHLDYHHTMENYLAAKTKLFQSLDSDSFAVINMQSPSSKFIASSTNAKILFYAVNAPADIQAKIITTSATETVYNLIYNSEQVEIHSPLIGLHNISNHLTAAGLAIAAGFSLEQIKAALEKTLIPGRLQTVASTRNFAVFVDYAHTDDALKNVLTALKPICKGKLTVVFGCGGDRDKTKRPRMAKVAQTLADKVIVTSDNPRTENPSDIIKDILVGFDSMENIITEPDRQKAIEIAIASACDNDIVLIAGKGHEDYQIIGSEKIHFSDTEIADKILNPTQLSD